MLRTSKLVGVSGYPPTLKNALFSVNENSPPGIGNGFQGERDVFNGWFENGRAGHSVSGAGVDTTTFFTISGAK